MTARSDHAGEEARISRLRIGVAIERLIIYAHRVSTHTAQRDRHKTDRENLLTGDPEYAAAGCGAVAKYYTALVALLFAYMLDLILVGVVAEYLAEEHFPNVKWLSAAARFFIPLALIGVENAIGAHIYEVDRQAGGRSTLSGRVWRLLGVAWALVIPLIVFGAQAVLHPETLRSAPWQGEDWLMLGVVFVAFALHLFVLYGGELNRVAQGYALFALRRAFHRWRERWNEARRAAACRESLIAFRRYTSQLQTHVEVYGETTCEALPTAVVIVLKEIGAAEPISESQRTDLLHCA